MPERLKVKLLIAIWGKRYIEEFARVSAPSYLAAGNLPSLAAEANLEILIMTSRASRRQFDQVPVFARLQALCPVRYICIDDLITTGNYGVTLTLAYARGIRDSGPEQTNTHFVFMNSDFVLADGSLRTLVERVQQGHRCIMAPSLRACSETAVATLVDAVDQSTNTLTMTPRRMVRLAFDNLHPTVIAKTRSQKFVNCATHNQIYWQVDDRTLIARYHLIFMLAIKPERPLSVVNSYCDYGFVPELVPSGEFSILDDSDEFFMLELQSKEQEKHFLRCGSATPNEIATELSAWTTREHRQFAEVDVIFRTADSSSRLPEARREVAAFVADVQARMKRRPISHTDHFYWTLGVQAWASLKHAENAQEFRSPPELEGQAWEASVERKQQTLAPVPHTRRGVAAMYMNLLGYARQISGVIPNVAIWHHQWLDSQLILGWVNSIRHRPHERNLLFCEPVSSLPGAMKSMIPIDITSVDYSEVDTTTGDPAFRQQPRTEELYDNVLIHARRANVRRLRQVLETAERNVRSGGTLTIFIEYPNAELDASNLTIELAQYVNDVLPLRWMRHRIQARFVGGAAKRRLRLAERWLLRYLYPTHAGKLPHLAAVMILWPFVALLTILNNLRSRNGMMTAPDFCTSALLSFSDISSAENGGASRVLPSGARMDGRATMREERAAATASKRRAKNAAGGLFVFAREGGHKGSS